MDVNSMSQKYQKISLWWGDEGMEKEQNQWVLLPQD
jgi:hypothetical protein